MRSRKLCDLNYPRHHPILPSSLQLEPEGLGIAGIRWVPPTHLPDVVHFIPRYH